jgi:hypothetical protein
MWSRIHEHLADEDKQRSEWLERFVEHERRRNREAKRRIAERAARRKAKESSPP